MGQKRGLYSQGLFVIICHRGRILHPDYSSVWRFQINRFLLILARRSTIIAQGFVGPLNQNALCFYGGVLCEFYTLVSNL